MYCNGPGLYAAFNKIKSSINGTQKKEGITKEEKEFSQLEKYYIFAEKEAEKSTPKKKTGYFMDGNFRSGTLVRRNGTFGGTWDENGNPGYGNVRVK